MQIDITPPPEGNKADGVVDTPVPIQPAAPTSPPPTLSLEAEGIEGEVIVVDVVDQTGGLLLDMELEVQLDGYDQFEQVYQDTQTLTAESRLVFDSVPFQAGRVFFASISHGGAIYRSDMFEAGDETTSMQMTVDIFETTTSDENILVERIHILTDFPSSHQLQIVEIFIVSNLGDTTFVSDNPGEPTLSFPLPVGAGSISFDDGALGERYVKTEDGFGDTVSIPPGSGVYQTLVYYTLPIQGSEYEFSQVMNYPVRAVIIMTPEGEAVVEGANLEDMGVQAIADGSVQIYSATSIPRGEILQFEVTVGSTDVVVQPDAPVLLSQWIIIAAGVLGGALLLTGTWLFIRQRNQNLEGDEFEGASGEREEILDSIIALEDLYKEGEITKKAYLKKRQELKDQLDSLADG